MKTKRRAPGAATPGTQRKVANSPKTNTPPPDSQAARAKLAEAALTSPAHDSENLSPKEQIENTVFYLEKFMDIGGHIDVERRSWSMSGDSSNPELPPKPSREAMWEVLTPEGVHHLIKGSRKHFDGGLVTIEEAAKELGLCRYATFSIWDCTPMNLKWLGGGLYLGKKTYIPHWKVRELGWLFHYLRWADNPKPSTPTGAAARDGWEPPRSRGQPDRGA